MSFNTLDFMLLFALVFILYYLLPQKLRNPMLLLASYIFYAAYHLPLTLYLLASTLVTYGIGLAIERTRGTGASKRWMIAGIVLDLGTLAFYKYFNFLSGMLGSLAGLSSPVRVDWLVPLGISFITFSTVSYLIDVYRGKLPGERSLFKYALFVAFFPKLVQGPIERAGDIIPQFDETHRFDLIRFREGMLMVLYGLFMKMVVADTAAIVVDMIFGDLNAYSGAAIVMAVVLFTLQIYCDFAGYSYTAIGAAKVLGFDFKQNFRQPYLSLSVSEFWRRWHISLNRWLTDYLYIPLGGSRCSTARRNFNVLVTFGLSGLWHGADWGFIIWGLLNGVYIIIETAVKRLFGKNKQENSAAPARGSGLRIFLNRALTFVLISFSWIFFRARNLSTAATAIRRIFTRFQLIPFLKYVARGILKGPGNAIFGLDVFFRIPPFILCVLVVIVVDVLANKRNVALSLAQGRRWLRWAVAYFLLFAIIILGVYGYGYNAASFIYAGF